MAAKLKAQTVCCLVKS